MPWLLIEIRDRYSPRQLKTIHIVPEDDDKPHQESGRCWCRPEQDEYGVYVHNSMDGREAYETGQRALN